MSGELNGLLSPFLRRQRISAALPFVRGRVLDWGCGSGALTPHCDPATYTGVDIERSVIETARERHPAAHFHLLDAFDDAAHGPFDTIVALAVIEHLPDPDAFISRMRGLLAPGGHIVLTTPNPNLDWAHGVGGRLGIFSKESHEEHQSLMDRTGIEAVARRSGMTVAVYRRFLFGANQLAVLAHQG